MINFILWLLFGALAGWIASRLMGTDAQQGALANIVVGILGAFIGGFLVRLLGGPVPDGFSLFSLLIAVVGAVVLLAIVKMFSRSAA